MSVLGPLWNTWDSDWWWWMNGGERLGALLSRVGPLKTVELFVIAMVAFNHNSYQVESSQYTVQEVYRDALLHLESTWIT